MAKRSVPAPAEVVGEELLRAIAEDEFLRVIFAVIAGLPPDRRKHLVWLASELMTMETYLLACLIKVVKPELTDERVARASGISVRTLYRYAPFKALKELMTTEEFSHPSPLGSKDDDGNLEAVLP